MDDITNEQLFWTLTQYTQFLKPFDLPDTTIKAYQNYFVETEHLKKDGVNIGIKELAAMLLLLIARKYLIPVSFKNTQIVNPKGDNTPFFILSSQQTALQTNCPFHFFDMNRAARSMEN
jgi:hypothetical protein